tara:strand:- start:2634 stop:2954 length:321 start_codon:yes stop_codon:yes gene_type:complete
MNIEISVTQAHELREKNPTLLFLDVREAEEVNFCKIPNSLHIPLGEIPHRLDSFPKDTSIIIYCHHGMRSMSAVNFLRAKGYGKATNLSGGIDAWSSKIDPNIPTY